VYSDKRAAAADTTKFGAGKLGLEESLFAFFGGNLVESPHVLGGWGGGT